MDAAVVKELRAGCGGLGQDKAAAKRVRDMLVALQQRQDGPAPEVFVLLNYVNGSLESRRELLTGPLFVRCAAAVLDGRYTGELQVDASAAGGCEVDKVAAALRLNLGETMYNPTEREKAPSQLQSVGKVAAYTLDKALAACFADPTIATTPALQKLPRQLYIHGVCVYVGRATKQQLARWEDLPRVELGGMALSGAADGVKGLKGATLVLSAASALERVLSTGCAPGWGRCVAVA
ncbi:hypothetical protein CHLRE_02g085400v5 [Chlamydomonas reinhardtii]|uniref:Uncharacterized protein n=1 Tax=Chlamydomonas reinhardtii TaxID=3055 RepID=A0A2K3E0V5_CHLRE|nr:uncharacterized protein CHLRE_02g085400v5 [Chlamydomonas reinhardtii]PNW86413.1 hypothetical protein CHLRE_02g085400v5 [Chlamydomonas reinhardtii]